MKGHLGSTSTHSTSWMRSTRTLFFMWSCGKTLKIDFEFGEDGEVRSIPPNLTLSLFSFTVRCCQAHQPQEVVFRTLAGANKQSLFHDEGTCNRSSQPHSENSSSAHQSWTSPGRTAEFKFFSRCVCPRPQWSCFTCCAFSRSVVAQCASAFHGWEVPGPQ